MPRRRLKSLRDVRRYIANLINRVESDEIDIQKARNVGYLANLLTKTIEGSEFEERLEGLERHVKELKEDTNNNNSGYPGSFDTDDYIKWKEEKAGRT